MALYYYDKFTSIKDETPIYNWQVVWGAEQEAYDGTYAGNTSYYLDSEGYVQLSGSYVNYDSVNGPTGTLYSGGGRDVYRSTATLGSKVKKTTGKSTYVQTGTNTSYSKGSLVQSNIAVEEGTYPANGRQSDGYWYVKGAAVGPVLPGQVINQPYSVNGNGGRKLVRVSDGTLMTVIRNVDYIKVYISQNEGSSWTYATQLGLAGVDTTDVVITVINANEVGFMYSYGNSIRFRKLVRNGSIFSFAAETTLDSPTSVATMSLAFDPTSGFLHAAWSCVTSTYPNAWNIRYARSTNGGVSWEPVVNATSFNVSSTHNSTPTIVGRKDTVPVIIYQQYDGSIYNIIAKRYENGSWQESKIYSGGSFQQLNPSAVIDKNGNIHVAWQSKGEGSKYSIVYCKSLDGGATWRTPEGVTGYDYSWFNPSLSVDSSGKVAVVYAGINPSISTTVNNIIARYVINGAWYNVPAVTSRTSGEATLPSVLQDNSYSGNFGTIPALVYQLTNTSIEYTGTYTQNSAPSIAVVSPTDKQTLYENDVMNINGDAYDQDKDQSVTVYYQINSDSRKVLATNVSQTQISLSKQLKFKAGKLYDGDIAITGNLADGVAHKLKVWAVDSENVSSSVVEKSFYVVPNRAPLLSVDTVVPSGSIDTDKFTISGTAYDQDANSTVTVNYQINSAKAVEIYSGTGGEWKFEVLLEHLRVGENQILIEVIDNYGAKTKKKVTLNKNEINTPVLESVARYKIEPPKGIAKGVLFWIQRDENLILNAELSMTSKNEQEEFVALTPTGTETVRQGIVEDEFYYETKEAKESIILKVQMKRLNANIDNKIYLISGVFD